MSKRAYWNRNACWLCGAPLVRAIDNFGQPYLGCSRCVVVDPSRAPEQTKEEANG